jgi:HSP20 family protein
MLSRFFGPGTGLSQQGDPFGTFQREMNRVFDEVFRGFPAMRGGAAMMGGFAPTLDVHETDKGLEIAAELPGMREEDIDLKLEGDLLTIAGEKRQERTDEQGGTHLSERSYGRFQRAFRLPWAPDPQQDEARFENGVLRVTLPRPAQQQQGSRIRIGGGGGAAADQHLSLGSGQQPGQGGSGAAQPHQAQPGQGGVGASAQPHQAQPGQGATASGSGTGPEVSREQDNRPGRAGRTA